MKAWAIVGEEVPLELIELPTPEPTGTEVLLEVTHCGVCHSDLHIWEGYYDIGGGLPHRHASQIRRPAGAIAPLWPCDGAG